MLPSQIESLNTQMQPINPSQSTFCQTLATMMKMKGMSTIKEIKTWNQRKLNNSNSSISRAKIQMFTVRSMEISQTKWNQKILKEFNLKA